MSLIKNSAAYIFMAAETQSEVLEERHSSVFRAEKWRRGITLKKQMRLRKLNTHPISKRNKLNRKQRSLFPRGNAWIRVLENTAFSDFG